MRRIAKRVWLGVVVRFFCSNSRAKNLIHRNYWLPPKIHENSTQNRAYFFRISPRIITHRENFFRTPSKLLSAESSEPQDSRHRQHGRRIPGARHLRSAAMLRNGIRLQGLAGNSHTTFFNWAVVSKLRGRNQGSVRTTG